MALQTSSPVKYTGTRDWSGGVDSIKTPTIASPELNPNGLARNQLAKLVNGTVRDGSLSPRDGWQSLGQVISASSLPALLGSTFQGDCTYVPNVGNPYKIMVIGGHVIKVDQTFASAPVDLSAAAGLFFIGTTTKAYFCQAGQFLVIQSGNYNPATKTGDLPLIWNGTTLVRSNGITGIQTRGTSIPTSYAVATNGNWTVPTVGQTAFVPTTVLYGGNQGDVVTVAVSASAPGADAGATCGIFKVIFVSTTLMELQCLSLAGGTLGTAGYVVPVGDTPLILTLTIPPTPTQAMTLQQTAFPNTNPTEYPLPTSLNLITSIAFFNGSYQYPGQVLDIISIAGSDSPSVLGFYQVLNIAAYTIELQWISGAATQGQPWLYLQYQNNDVSPPTYYLNVPAAGQNVSLPISSADPAYIGSIGDTISVTGYGTYKVLGFSQPSGDINTGNPILLQAIAPLQVGTPWPLSFNITVTAAPTGSGTLVNQIPSAGPMTYYMQRIWYANGAAANAGDIVGGPSGTLAYNYQDSVLYVTENPLVLGGDGFTMPSGNDNITGFGIPQMINASLGQGLLNIGTQNAIFALQVPVTRADWIAANAANAPQIFVVQQSNGWVNDWCVVGINGDLWYQSLAPDIRSLLTAVRYFQQWGGVSLSSNEDYILNKVNTALMQNVSGVFFDNRLWMTTLPTQTPFGIVHNALIPLDLEPISTLEEQLPPNWEGHAEGLLFLQLTTAVVNGQQQMYGVVLNPSMNGQIELWQYVPDSIGDNGVPIEWEAVTPGFTWYEHGLELSLKKLVSGEMWVDKLKGTATVLIEYSADGSSCWKEWLQFIICNATDSSQLQNPQDYPVVILQSGVRRPLVFPLPPDDSSGQTQRPANVAFEFQIRLTVTGSLSVRGLFLKAEEVNRGTYEDMIGG